MYVVWEDLVFFPFTMLIEVELPFWGPHTSWKSSPGDQLKSDGAVSPSIMNVTLNCSPSDTSLGA